MLISLRLWPKICCWYNGMKSTLRNFFSSNFRSLELLITRRWSSEFRIIESCSLIWFISKQNKPPSYFTIPCTLFQTILTYAVWKELLLSWWMGISTCLFFFFFWRCICWQCATLFPNIYLFQCLYNNTTNQFVMYSPIHYINDYFNI